MKFTKTSSTIAQNHVSLNFNISQISYILKETRLYDWDYFITQWLTPPFDKWQLFRRPPGFATIAINESFNKQFKESFTKYIQSICLKIHCLLYLNFIV